MIWRVQLLGGVSIARGSHVICHFESSRVAALLARLALFSKHPTSREELIELLWPDEDAERGRHRLRQAIYSLRRQLEPPGIPPHTVLSADRITVNMIPGTFSCDAVEFEQCVGESRFGEARALYRGELLPGYYDDWILTERYRLQDLFEQIPDASPSLSKAPAGPTSDKLPYISLPRYLTEYFGREDEKRLVRESLSRQRLITITGIGGVGKTRLAVEVARAAATTFDRTAFVPLEECISPGDIFERIPPALQLPPSQASPIDQMTYALTGCKILLVLDNFEQLVGTDGGDYVEELLNQFPDMECIVTSRRLLGVSGECEVPLSPLPAAVGDGLLEEIACNPSIALFLSRAQSARPAFQMTESNRDDIVALCSALDGLPLALEIAASRIRAFTPKEMLIELEDRFRLLARPGRGTHKDQRHRSLLATLEWSWRLLAPVQQKLLSALSVFRGGWTAVLAAEVCDIPNVEERLESLMMDSLVIGEETKTNTTRFRMLDIVREYARVHLDSRVVDELVRRHQDAFLALARRLRGGNQSLLLTEGENLKAAVEAAIYRGDADRAFGLCVAVDETWLPILGRDRAQDLFRRTLTLTGGEVANRVEMLSGASRLALLIENRAHALSLASEALAISGDDPTLRSLSLVTLSRAKMVQTEEATLQVKSLLEEAIALAQSVSAERTLGTAYRLLGVVSTRLNDYGYADRCLNDALNYFKMAGDRQGAIHTWDNLGGVAVALDELDRALELYGEARKRAEEINEVTYSAKVLQNIATIYARQKRWPESLAIGQECIRRNQALGNAFILAFALWNITEPLTYLNRHEEAACLMSFIEQFWVERYDPLNADEQGYIAMIRSRVVTALGESATSVLWSAGTMMTLDEAIRTAIQLSP